VPDGGALDADEDAAELDDAAEVDEEVDEDEDEDEDEGFSSLPQPVATVSKAVIATPTPTVRTTLIVCLRSMTAISTAPITPTAIHATTRYASSGERR
jgi:hypothetical protein